MIREQAEPVGGVQLRGGIDSAFVIRGGFRDFTIGRPDRLAQVVAGRVAVIVDGLVRVLLAVVLGIFAAALKVTASRLPQRRAHGERLELKDFPLAGRFPERELVVNRLKWKVPETNDGYAAD